jgi:hypothetical protein
MTVANFFLPQGLCTLWSPLPKTPQMADSFLGIYSGIQPKKDVFPIPTPVVSSLSLTTVG